MRPFLVNKIGLLLFFLLPLLGFSQKSDSTKIKITGIGIYGGVGLVQYYGISFFNNANYLAGFNSPSYCAKVGSSFTAGGVGYGDTIPSKYNFKSLTNSFCIGLGVEFPFRNRASGFNNFVGFHYTQYSGEYAYNIWYTEHVTHNSLASANIFDSVKAPYTQSIYSLDYKLQYTYKSIFISCGIGFNFNLVKINQQKREWQDYSSYNELSNKWYYDTAFIYTNTTKEVFYLSVPIQMGVGARINLNNLLIEPAFYFTPCISENYLEYNLSLRLIYSIY